MAHALRLAKRNEGLTGGNPAVGCVIADADGIIYATGVTAFCGRPHAEVIAMKQFEQIKPNSTTDLAMYITLEPCSHYGKTPPCAEQIIKFSKQFPLKRIIIGSGDRDTRVNGAGIKTLQTAGLEVIFDTTDLAIQDFYKPYNFARRNLQPFVTIKIGASVDGKISTNGGESKWITSDGMRRYTNFLRSKVDGILIGGGTFRKDHPQLTCRIAGLEEFSPKQFILSASAESADFTVVHGNLKGVLQEIYQKHEVNHLLVEGGTQVITSFLKENLVQRIIAVTGSALLGGESRGWIEELGISKMHETIKLELKSAEVVGSNTINTYDVRETQTRPVR